MSRNKLYVVFLISIILVVIFYVSYGMLNIGKESESYTVSVIVDNSSDARWNAFKEGLSQGASGKRIYLNIVSTAQFSDIEEECQIVARELENGADGVIVEPCSSEDAEDLFTKAVGTGNVVLVENMITLPVEYYSAVMPDHYALGEAAADAVLQGESGSERLRIGILGGNQKKVSMQQRLLGFQDAVSGTNTEIAWTITGDGEYATSKLEYYMNRNGADILVALDNNEMERAVDFLLENKEFSCRLYGEGRSEKAVYYLDKGLIQTLIVPNEYYMGYQSLMLMEELLETHTGAKKNVDVDFVAVTKENMYDKEIGRILFPAVR